MVTKKTSWSEGGIRILHVECIQQTGYPHPTISRELATNNRQTQVITSSKTTNVTTQQCRHPRNKPETLSLPEHASRRILIRLKNNNGTEVIL